MSRILLVAWLLIASTPLLAADLVVNGKLGMVAVNGGNDTLNPGTTCFLLDVAVSSTCTSGYLAIPNNNKELFSALLHAKATGAPVGIYYRDNSTQQHCPGIVFTTCEAISIQLH